MSMRRSLHLVHSLESHGLSRVFVHLYFYFGHLVVQTALPSQLFIQSGPFSRQGDPDTGHHNNVCQIQQASVFISPPTSYSFASAQDIPFITFARSFRWASFQSACVIFPDVSFKFAKLASTLRNLSRALLSSPNCGVSLSCEFFRTERRFPLACGVTPLLSF